MAKQSESVSPREMDVLNAMRRGATNKEIAAELSISANTVKTHVRNLYAKLDASTRTEAILRATEQGMFAPTVAPVEPKSTPALPETTSSPTKMMPIVIGGALLAVLLIGLTAWIITRNRPDESELVAKESAFTPTQIGDTPWRTAPTLPSGRTGFAIASVGSELYVIGGETETETASAEGFALNPRENVWRPFANKPTAVKHAPAAVILGQIIVPGGEFAEGATDVVEIYSPSADAWRTTSTLPQPTSGSVALAHDDTLYLFGGVDDSGIVTNGVFAWEPETGLWRPLPDMPTGRAHATGGIVDDILYIVGGVSGLDATNDPLNVCEKFDPAMETWETCPPLQHPRAYASGTTILNKLYVMGGSDAAEGEQFTAELGWQPFPLPMFTNETWQGNGTTTIETRLYTLGGVLDGEMTADHYSWNALPYQYFIPSTLNE